MSENKQSENIYIGAPYNFVPFEDKTYAPVDRAGMEVHDIIDDSLMSGEILYQIEAKTPVMIDSGKGTFFKNERGRFAIPGSTMRGLLRNNVQILSASSFDRDIDDYLLMYRHVASGALKEKYNDVLGNKAIRYGKRTLSILKNVKAGEMTCEKGDYFISPTIDEHIGADSDLPNYYVLSERTITEDYQKNEDKSSFFFFWKNGDIMQNKHDVPFNKCEKDGKTNYKGEENPSYEPYYKECSYKASGKEVTAVDKPGVHPNKGYVISSGKMKNKKVIYIIPEIDRNGEKIKIPASDIKAYNIDYNKKINSLVTQFHGDKKAEEEKEVKEEKAEEYYGLVKEGERKPVFYIEQGGRLYFGFTPRLRLFFKHSIKEGYRQKQPGEDRFDLATSIFGLSDNKIGSYKSKVAVCDAVIRTDNKPMGEKKVVLAEPKPTSYLDYLEQSKKGTKTYSSDGDKNAETGFKLRGVKQYWLREKITDDNKEKNNDKIVSPINPLPEGTVFDGIIRFDNLTKQELGLLLWALKLDDNSEMNLGKGKPYGYGVIRISNIKARMMEYSKAYSMENFEFDPFKDINVDELIGQYKENTIVFDEKKVTELDSVKTLFDMKDANKKPSEDLIRYMDINQREYQNRKLPLPSVTEVISSNTVKKNLSHKNATSKNSVSQIVKTIKRLKQDSKYSDYEVGYLELGGMVFGIPKDTVKEGEKIVVTQSGKNNNFWTYKGKA